MEGSAPAAPNRVRRRRVLLVLVVAAAVVAASFFVWWGFIRPRTIAEVFNFDHFQPGAAVTVAGTITGIYPESTSYGPKVALQLDGYSQLDKYAQLEYFSPCNGTGQVFGDPNTTYAIGQTFQTTLHFQDYTINGDPAVWAPELACPFPLTFKAIQAVDDAVSRVAGLTLVYNSTESGGWVDYSIFTANAVPYNLRVLPVTLRKSAPVEKANPVFPNGSAVDSPLRWVTLSEIQYVGLVGSSRVFPIVDQMGSLVDGTSVNGSLRYIDTNGDHMLDDGDRLDIRLPPTSSANSWDTYVVEIGGLFFSNRTYVAAQHYILDGPDGPTEPSFSGQTPIVDLAWAGDQPGPPLQSAVRVTAAPIGPPLPVAAVRYSLTVKNGITGYAQLSGNLTSLPTTTGTGVTLSFDDSDGDHLLDTGDRFTVTGAANRSDLSLDVFGPSGGAGSIDWIIGYGSVAGIPYLNFTAQGTGTWTIRANVPTWSPELAFNRTVRATLYENDSAVVTNATLVNGTLGTFGAGSLTFTDADGDGYLSTGDFFTLTGNPGAYYRLDVTFLFGAEGVIAFSSLAR